MGSVTLLRRAWPLAAAGAFGFWLGHTGSSVPVERAVPSAPAAPRSATAAVNAPALPAAAPSSARWLDLLALPASPSRDDALATAVETLAAHDPAAALARVQAQTNRLLRDRLTLALLRGWATTAPLDAAHWAMSAAAGNSEAALTAVFSGAVAASPQTAVQLGTELTRESPADVLGCGTHLIDALCHAGQFEAAAQFALAGDPGRQPALLGEAYSQWASYQPDRAAAAASVIADPATRTQALHGVIGGWAAADPAGAVQFANALPPDAPDRASLTGQALQRWARTDLKAASDWMNNHELGAAMDGAVATIATQDYVKPDVALSWAESVVDPKRRSETLSSVLRRWATSDLSAARHYAESTHDLLPEDRQEIEGLIATLSGNGS